METVTACIFITTPDYRITFAGGAYQEIFDIEDPVGLSCGAILLTGNEDEYKCPKITALITEKEFKSNITVDINGNKKNLELHIYPKIEGNVLTSLVINLVDITSIELLRASLKKTEAFFSVMMYDQPSLVYRYDMDFNIEFANDRVTEMAGLSNEELLGKKIFDIMDDDNIERARYQISQLTNKNPTRTHEHQQRWTKGSNDFRWVQWTDRLVFSDDGEPLGYQGVGYDITERKLAEMKMQELAFTDPLTLLLNRRRFFELANAEQERSLRFKHKLSILMIDIDFFKKINDTHGHSVGDVVLKIIADSLKKGLRDIDLICRYGGEEFVVLMPETDMSTAIIAAERLKNSMEFLNPVVGNNNLHFTVSIGVRVFEQGESIESLISEADKALYRAKETGRNRVVVWGAF